MESKTLIERIAERQEKLKDVAVELKQHFVGIDHVIDKVIANIEAWYCMPELLTRPTIVCLWGLTGIGKTDLVRRLIKALSLVDNFVEIQLTNKGSSSDIYASTLQGLLTSSNISNEEPGVLFLDEIQRFRSIDSDGEEIHDYRFQDLWMLLSDGSFGTASHNKQKLMEILLEAAYLDDYNNAKRQVGLEESDEDDDEEDAKKNEELAKKRKFKQSYWSACMMKRQLRLTENLDDIMQWDSKRKLEILMKKMEDKSIYDSEVYSKLLIFVSGNIDEAYSMASQTEETDVDADVFHKHSLKINLLGIKTALKNRFKPEQIARFGNTHIVYPALCRSSYEEIIRRKVKAILDNVELASGVRIIPDQSVYDAIYRNGVFPVQGTRPVFSTIASFFETALPTFTLRALQCGQKKIYLRYEDKNLTAMVGDQTVRIFNEGDIDKIKKQKRNEETIRKISVHEAGHSVAYSVLFGVMPTQVVVNVATRDANGFIGIHEIDGSRNQILNEITCLLSGRAAEEIVFGKDNIGNGAVSDIDRATSRAALYVRNYGMGKTLSKTTVPMAPNANLYNVDTTNSNFEIIEILNRQHDRATTLLNNHISLLHDLSDYLIENGKIESTDYIEIFARHGVPVTVLDAKEAIVPKYQEQYNDFWGKKKLDAGDR